MHPLCNILQQRSFMLKRVTINITSEEYRNIQQKAKSFGLSASSYLRTIIRDSVRRDFDIKHSELLKAFKGIVIILAEGLGRSQGKSEREIEQLSQILLERYIKEIAKI